MSTAEVHQNPNSVLYPKQWTSSVSNILRRRGIVQRPELFHVANNKILHPRKKNLHPWQQPDLANPAREPKDKKWKMINQKEKIRHTNIKYKIWNKFTLQQSMAKNRIMMMLSRSLLVKPNEEKLTLLIGQLSCQQSLELSWIADDLLRVW